MENNFLWFSVIIMISGVENDLSLFIKVCVGYSMVFFFKYI